MPKTFAPSGGGIPGGSDTQVQFNDAGVFAGDSGLLFNKTSNSLAVAGYVGIATTTTPDISGTLLHVKSTATTIADASGTLPKVILSGTVPINIASLNTSYSTDVSNGVVLSQSASGVATLSSGNGTLAVSNKGGHISIDPTSKFIEIRPGSGRGNYWFSVVNDPTNGTELNSNIFLGRAKADSITNYGNFNIQARISDGSAEAISAYQYLNEMTWTSGGGFTQDLWGIWDSNANAYVISAYAALGRTLRVGYPVSGSDFTLQANGPINNADPTTRTVSTPLYNGSQTWNDAGVTFVGHTMDFTSTASAAASLIADWKVGGSSKFSVRKDGLVTLGTPLPIASGGTGATTLAGANIAVTTGTLAQFAATTSAQLAGVISDETGSGALVFATSPTLVTPALGTPSSGTLTSCTGLPISTGVSGLGTGVATFLATPTSANFAAAVTGETGTGGVVFDTAPTINTSLTVGGPITRTDGGTGTVPKLLSAQVGSSDTITASTVGTTETAFATTYTIPANTIGANTVTRVTLVIEYTSSGGVLTTVLRGKLGGTAFYQSNAGAAPAGTSVGGMMTFVLQGTAAPGASVNVESGGQQGFLYLNVQSQNVTAQPVAFATNGNLALSFTVQYSSNTAGNSITLRQLIVEHY